MYSGNNSFMLRAVTSDQFRSFLKFSCNSIKYKKQRLHVQPVSQCERGLLRAHFVTVFFRGLPFFVKEMHTKTMYSNNDQRITKINGA